MSRALVVLALAAALAAGPAAALEVQGHRGARGLAPENTLAGVDQALATGVTILELDVAMTADGVLVLHHDLSLNPDVARGSDGAYVTQDKPIVSLSYDELAAYDVGRLRPGSEYARRFADQLTRDGARVPTLRHVFDRLDALDADHVLVALEIRTSPVDPDRSADPQALAEALVAAVREADLVERVRVQSFDWRALDAVAALAPEIPRVCLTSEGEGDTLWRDAAEPSPWLGGRDLAAAGGSAPKLAAEAGCAVWGPDHRALDEERLAEARALGLAVTPWVVNEPTEMARLIALGVDGLITDYPNRLRALLVERGLAAPAQVRVPNR